MDRHTHLFVNLLLTSLFGGFLWLVHYFGFFRSYIESIANNFFNFSGDFFLIWVASIFIFSNLADIDNSNARVSIYFFLCCISLIGYGAYKAWTWTGVLESLLIGLLSSVLGILLIVYHQTIQIDGWNHRRFPHTFTFGMFASLLFFFFLMWLKVSLVLTFALSFLSFIYFFTHILIDGFLDEALQRDRRFWNSDINGKIALIFCKY